MLVIDASNSSPRFPIQCLLDSLWQCTAATVLCHRTVFTLVFEVDHLRPFLASPSLLIVCCFKNYRRWLTNGMTCSVVCINARCCLSISTPMRRTTCASLSSLDWRQKTARRTATFTSVTICSSTSLMPVTSRLMPSPALLIASLMANDRWCFEPFNISSMNGAWCIVPSG